MDRSEIMRAVRRLDTGPELIVRRTLHRLGFRFRLHRKDLPGTPDIVLPKSKTAIFVHGCFWHRHRGCRYTTTPKTNAAFWDAKFSRNIERDRQNEAKLAELGWRVLIVWQCETKNTDRLATSLRQSLASASSPERSTGRSLGSHVGLG